MQLVRCQLCNRTMDPADKRYRLIIRIQADEEENTAEEEAFSTDDCLCSLEESLEEECFKGLCHKEEESDFFQEMQLVICQPCQIQFSKNPYMQECLLFIGREAHPKTIH